MKLDLTPHEVTSLLSGLDALAYTIRNAQRANEGDPISGLREKRLEELQELADKIMEQRDA